MAISPRSAPFPYPYHAPYSQFGEWHPGATMSVKNCISTFLESRLIWNGFKGLQELKHWIASKICHWKYNYVRINNVCFTTVICFLNLINIEKISFLQRWLQIKYFILIMRVETRQVCWPWITDLDNKCVHVHIWTQCCAVSSYKKYIFISK